MYDKPEWKLVTEYVLRDYPCGLSAGDMLRLRKDIVVNDHRQKPTGVVYVAGGLWTVLTGTQQEPGVVWLRQPDGDRHTWDDSDIFEWFEKVAVS